MAREAECVKAEVLRMRRAVPFRRFAITLLNGDRAVVEHPENIALDPTMGAMPGSIEFVVFSGNTRMFGAFDAVSSVSVLEDSESGY